MATLFAFMSVSGLSTTDLYELGSILLLLLAVLIAVLRMCRSDARLREMEQRAKVAEKSNNILASLVRSWHALSPLRHDLQGYAEAIRRYNAAVLDNSHGVPNAQLESELVQKLLDAENQLRRAVLRIVCNVENKTTGPIAANCVFLIMNSLVEGGVTVATPPVVNESLERLHNAISAL